MQNMEHLITVTVFTLRRHLAIRLLQSLLAIKYLTSQGTTHRSLRKDIALDTHYKSTIILK